MHYHNNFLNNININKMFIYQLKPGRHFIPNFHVRYQTTTAANLKLNINSLKKKTKKNMPMQIWSKENTILVENCSTTIAPNTSVVTVPDFLVSFSAIKLQGNLTDYNS